MTASATTARSRSTTSTPLRDAAAALRDAEAGLPNGDSTAAHEALRALARLTYRNLQERRPEPPTDA